MMRVTLEEAKQCLRIDSSDEDSFLSSLMDTAHTLVMDICRKTDDEIKEDQDVVKTAELYAISYMYEHRDEADHKALILTLKYLLFGVREEDF